MEPDPARQGLQRNASLVGDRRRRVGLGHWLYQRFEQTSPTYYWNSVLVLVLALYLLALAFWESSGRSPAATTE